MKNLTKQQIQDAINSSKSMAQAAHILNVNYKTFRTYTQRHGLWVTNQPGKGITKRSFVKIPLSDILSGATPYSNIGHLRRRLIKEGVFEHKCDSCNRTHWMSKLIPLDLHHIDGNSANHKKHNLQLLCPNCHSLTPNYGKKKSSL